jgi:hypothetical protein
MGIIIGAVVGVIAVVGACYTATYTALLLQFAVGLAANRFWLGILTERHQQAQDEQSQEVHGCTSRLAPTRRSMKVYPALCILGGLVVVSGNSLRTYGDVFSSAARSSQSCIRIGFLGRADIVKLALLTPAARRPGMVVIVGLAARSVQDAIAFKQQHLEYLSNATVYSSYSALLTSPDVDGVYIALPTSLHFEWAALALAAGKHVLLEKPLTSNAVQAEALVALARQRNLVLMHGLHNAFTGGVGGYLLANMVRHLLLLSPPPLEHSRATRPARESGAFEAPLVDEVPQVGNAAAARADGAHEVDAAGEDLGGALLRFYWYYGYQLDLKSSIVMSEGPETWLATGPGWQGWLEHSPGMLSINDPLKPESDLGAKAFRYNIVRQLLRASYVKLSAQVAEHTQQQLAFGVVAGRTASGDVQCAFRGRGAGGHAVPRHGRSCG